MLLVLGKVTMAEEEVSREASTLVYNVLGTFTFGTSQKQRYAVFKCFQNMPWNSMDADCVKKAQICV